MINRYKNSCPLRISFCILESRGWSCYMFDYADYDGIGLAGLIREKEIGISELLESVIDRIEKLNPVLNSVVYKTFEKARKRASELGLQS